MHSYNRMHRSLHNLLYRPRTLSDTWMGYVFVHLSGYNCIQKLHTGLAKHVHLSGLCTYPGCTYPGFTVLGFRILTIAIGYWVLGSVHYWVLLHVYFNPKFSVIKFKVVPDPNLSILKVIMYFMHETLNTAPVMPNFQRLFVPWLRN